MRLDLAPCGRCGLAKGNPTTKDHGYGDCAAGCWCYGVCWGGPDGACWELCRSCGIALDGCPHGRGGLHITRKFGEAVWIGNARVVVRQGPSINQVRVQIQAPNDVTIVREELRRTPQRSA